MRRIELATWLVRSQAGATLAAPADDLTTIKWQGPAFRCPATHATITSLMVAGSFQTWKWYVLPVERWTSVTPIREEDVANRLAGLKQVYTTSTIWGNRTVRGDVSFGTVRLAIVTRDPGVVAAWPDTPDNPMLYSAWLVVRGKIKERDGTTEVRLWALPGSSAAAALAIPLGFVIGFGYGWLEGVLPVGSVLAPLAVYVLVWKLVSDLLASVREHVARAVAAS